MLNSNVYAGYCEDYFSALSSIERYQSLQKWGCEE